MRKRLAQLLQLRYQKRSLSGTGAEKHDVCAQVRSDPATGFD
jgi:hypothetical protein